MPDITTGGDRVYIVGYSTVADANQTLLTCTDVDAVDQPVLYYNASRELELQVGGETVWTSAEPIPYVPAPSYEFRLYVDSTEAIVRVAVTPYGTLNWVTDSGSWPLPDAAEMASWTEAGGSLYAISVKTGDDAVPVFPATDPGPAGDGGGDGPTSLGPLHPFGEDAVFQRRVQIGTDGGGNPIYDWVDQVTLLGCAFDPGGSVEPAPAGALDRIITTPTLYTPYGSGVIGSDRCTLRGILYEVEGHARAFRNPMSGHGAGDVISLKLVEG